MVNGLLTLREVADMLNVHPRTIRRWIVEGKLPARKLPGRFGGEYRITEADAQALLAAPAEPAVVAPIEFATCAATKADGKPCKAPALHGSRYCRHHQGREKDGE